MPSLRAPGSGRFSTGSPLMATSGSSFRFSQPLGRRKLGCVAHASQKPNKSSRGGSYKAQQVTKWFPLFGTSCLFGKNCRDDRRQVFYPKSQELRQLLLGHLCRFGEGAIQNRSFRRDRYCRRDVPPLPYASNRLPEIALPRTVLYQEVLLQPVSLFYR